MTLHFTFRPRQEDPSSSPKPHRFNGDDAKLEDGVSLKENTRRHERTDKTAANQNLNISPLNHKISKGEKRKSCGKSQEPLPSGQKPCRKKLKTSDISSDLPANPPRPTLAGDDCALLERLVSNIAADTRLLSNDLSDVCRFRCELCSSDINYDMLRFHLSRSHGDMTVEAYDEQVGGIKISRAVIHTCVECGAEVVASKANLNQHLKVHGMSYR